MKKGDKVYLYNFYSATIIKVQKGSLLTVEITGNELEPSASTCRKGQRVLVHSAWVKPIN